MSWVSHLCELTADDPVGSTPLADDRTEAPRTHPTRQVPGDVGQSSALSANGLSGVPLDTKPGLVWGIADEIDKGSGDHTTRWYDKLHRRTYSGAGRVAPAGTAGSAHANTGNPTSTPPDRDPK